MWCGALSGDISLVAVIPYSNISLQKGLEHLRTVDYGNNDRVTYRSNSFFACNDVVMNPYKTLLSSKERAL